MKRKIIVWLGACFTIWSCSMQAEIEGLMLAQNQDDFFDEEIDEFDEQGLEEERKRRAEEEKKRREEEEQRALEAKRQSMLKRQKKEEKMAQERAKELDALRESAADSTEYTLDPSSVELVVEMDPNNYGFRTRNHRMTLSSEFDFILRGRSILHYDYRFFNYLSVGVLAGMDWSDMSLYSRFRDHLAKPAPKQFSILTGVSSKWRMTEWYMRSSIFLEPSLLFGYMWQTLLAQETTHWRLRPGIFSGIETVFDSGLTLNTRVGVEFPIDFGSKNPIREVVEPLLMLGLGLAI